MLPGKASRLSNHKYENDGLEILKLSAIYGANGSGKTNFIKSVSLLQLLLLNDKIPNSLVHNKFKLSKKSLMDPIELGIEFFHNSTFFYYSVALNEGKIIDEYLALSGPNRKEDELVFHRSIDSDKLSIKFSDEFNKSPENVVLKNLIEKDLLKPDKTLFRLLDTISNDAFRHVKIASDWFKNYLEVIHPASKISALSIHMDHKPQLHEFANSLLSSFNTGIQELKIEKNSLKDFLGEDNETELQEITTNLVNNPEEIAQFTNQATGEQVFAENDNGKIVVKKLSFTHKSEDGDSVSFSFHEESDGTKRLIEYVPAFNDLIKKDATYLVDEIERSIHPIIIKEIISKFSLDSETKGQLIFSTHESNLLDQDIFRTDEIWFAQKDSFGATKLYSLADFKEHSTIDIRKGYLNGRYGAIPFTGNLIDLNWNKNAGEE